MHFDEILTKMALSKGAKSDEIAEAIAILNDKPKLSFTFKDVIKLINSERIEVLSMREFEELKLNENPLYYKLGLYHLSVFTDEFVAAEIRDFFTNRKWSEKYKKFFIIEESFQIINIVDIETMKNDRLGFIIRVCSIK